MSSIQGAPDAARIDADETAYLCEQASRYFARPVVPADVVWAYSGVRPLLDDASGDASAVTRDYLLEFDGGVGTAAPLLTVWGGKITTFRKLAEEAADGLAAAHGRAAPGLDRAALLPGGDLSAWIGPAQRPDTDIARFIAAGRRHPQLPARWCALGALLRRRVDQVLAGGTLGAEVAPNLFESELTYLHDHEWARCADDVLWRRSKLGLHYSPAEQAAVAQWWAARYGAPATQAEAACS
jgi:glycerol-3-phosphate dehydrogenase